jgi:hypothetical protein
MSDTARGISATADDPMESARAADGATRRLATMVTRPIRSGATKSRVKTRASLISANSIAVFHYS